MKTRSRITTTAKLVDVNRPVKPVKVVREGLNSSTPNKKMEALNFLFTHTVLTKQDKQILKEFRNKTALNDLVFLSFVTSYVFTSTLQALAANPNASYILKHLPVDKKTTFRVIVDELESFDTDAYTLKSMLKK